MRVRERGLKPIIVGFGGDAGGNLPFGIPAYYLFITGVPTMAAQGRTATVFECAGDDSIFRKEQAGSFNMRVFGFLPTIAKGTGMLEKTQHEISTFKLLQEGGIPLIPYVTRKSIGLEGDSGATRRAVSLFPMLHISGRKLIYRSAMRTGTLSYFRG